MIPKKIHYCWFGENKLSEFSLFCIKSWKKYFPDYEIIEWNESNYNVNKIPYIKEAYNEKLYAFVSDFVRFDIIYNYGGIYFDTDVEVIKSFGDILNNDAFMGMEEIGLVATGLGFGAKPYNFIISEIINFYRNKYFIFEKSFKNMKTVVTNVSNILSKYGLKKENTIQSVLDIKIYPIEYFCPKSMATGKLEITNNTVTIHHFAGSWVPYEINEKNKERWFFYSKYGNDLYLTNLFERNNYLIKYNINEMSLRSIYLIVIKRTFKKFIYYFILIYKIFNKYLENEKRP